MATRVEWDRKNKVALQYMEDHFQQPQTLGNTRLPDAETEWVDVIDDYPPDYLPQFPSLMGNISEFYEAEDGTVHRIWPDADYSEAAVRSAAAARVVAAADNTLRPTDRVVLEALEQGDPVPPDVANVRQRIRSRRDQEAAALVDAPVEVVIDNVPDFGDLASETAVIRLKHGWPNDAPPRRQPPAQRPQDTPPPPDAEA